MPGTERKGTNHGLTLMAAAKTLEQNFRVMAVVLWPRIAQPTSPLSTLAGIATANGRVTPRNRRTRLHLALPLLIYSNAGIEAAATKISWPIL